MKLAVLGNDDSFEELTQGAQGIEWVRVANIKEGFDTLNIDGFFNLADEASDFDYSAFSIPVFINSVSTIAGNKRHITRINAWSGFLQNSAWEISGDYSDAVKAVLEKLNKKIILTADVPGFISASVIAMIINEAYYAIEEQISTEAEIDLAMKLGTNYPYGPFEWATKIGLNNIHSLLQSLSKDHSKYAPAPLLTQAINQA